MKLPGSVALPVILLLSISAAALGQGTTSILTGAVESSGVSLPGVTVTISSPGLQGTRTAITDVNGNYTFGALPPGTYRVTFEMEGMQTVMREAVVPLATTVRASAEMRVAAVGESITVTAGAPAVLETVEVQANFDAAMVGALPLSRNLINTAELAPGVSTRGTAGLQVAISGSVGSETLWLINGVVVNENVRNQVHSLYIADAIQEQTVLTGAISAEYGRFTGGVVSAITKSGGNDFSGSLRDNLTNEAWAEKTPLPSQPDPLDEVGNVYEATVGGRILTDRLWFFTAGRHYEINTGSFLSSSLAEVPPSSIPFTATNKQTRWEIKLTGQATPSHSLVGSYLSNELIQRNYCSFNKCLEISSIDESRSLPNALATARYSGIFGPNLLVELGYSKKTFSFQGGGGDFADFAHGSFGYDVNTKAFFGAPVFCGFCDPENRDNRNYSLKTTYYLATRALGTHSLVAGFDDFAEQRKSNNYQSGSNFSVAVYSSPERAADGTMRPIIEPGDLIGWWPIVEASLGSDLATRSIFANDRWDLTRRWSFNLGARYDANDSVDAGGAKTSDDSAFSPRLGATWDLFADGRLRVSAGYSRYVSSIKETMGGTGGTSAGNPAYFYYQYGGPPIRNLPTPEAFQKVWDWFQSVGGTDRTDLIVVAEWPGVNTVIREGLRSPNADEITAGAGFRLGGGGFARLDYVNRTYHDYYAKRADTTTGRVTDGIGRVFDLGILENSNRLERRYDAVVLQAGYRFTPHFAVGGNYTWSELRGNALAENLGSGPIAHDDAVYPEYKAFPQNNPVGYLPTDQTHRLRAWGSYELVTRAGRFTVGAIERFDSGTPYQLGGAVDPRPYVKNPGYATPPNAVNYAFSRRGEFRWDSAAETDLSLAWEVPVMGVNAWVKGDLLNALNGDAQISGNTSVLTARSPACIQNVGANAGKRCATFNPFTETPVEGVNYREGPNFGKATAVTDYQVPRTYRFAVGIRF